MTNEELLEQQKELADTLRKQVEQLATVQLSASEKIAALLQVQDKKVLH